MNKNLTSSDRKEIQPLVNELNRVSKELVRDGYTLGQIKQYPYIKELQNKINTKILVASTFNKYMNEN